jgi:hypothetical protein
MDIKKQTEEEQWRKNTPFTNQQWHTHVPLTNQRKERMETKRLIFFVIFMSIFVLVLFGLAPPT